MWEKLRASVLARFDGNVELAAANSEGVLRELGLEQLRIAVVGAAPCPRKVIGFWNALGIPLAETYGASETSGVATLNPPHAIKAGTAGPPLPGVEVHLSAEGEVLVRGPVVMRGYRNLPDETQRRSTTKAGCTPATSACSTTTATCGSSTGSRRSSSTPPARTCHQPTSRRRSRPSRR
jgi:acyl-CoA synthetase (AMP-forming)/AMP-acid ligase II